MCIAALLCLVYGGWIMRRCFGLLLLAFTLTGCLAGMRSGPLDGGIHEWHYLTEEWLSRGGLYGNERIKPAKKSRLRGKDQDSRYREMRQDDMKGADDAPDGRPPGKKPSDGSGWFRDREPRKRTLEDELRR